MSSNKYRVTLRRTPPVRLAPHPDAPTEQQWRAWVGESTLPIAVSLFSGAGGLSYGLTSAGYQVVLSVDTDKWALESHAHNVPGLALRRDLAESASRDEIVTLLEGRDVDLVSAGPPCQPFSAAGRSKIRSLVNLGQRDSVDMRKGLWQAFLDIVDRVQPRAVLFENVPHMALGDDMMALRLMIDRLERANYHVDARIVDTSLHGVPQHRRRLILIGIRGGPTFEWPKPVEPVTVREAIGDLPVLDVSSDVPIGAEMMEYHCTDLSDFTQKARRGCVGEQTRLVYDHLTRPVREDDYGIFKIMTSDTLYSELPDEMKRYRDDIFVDKYKRLDWLKRSRTITAHIAKDGYWYIHPDQHRTLTIREAARLQTFPDTFRFAGWRSHQFRQIGNAVPPTLGEVLGSALLTCLDSKNPAQDGRLEKRLTFRENLGGWAEGDAEKAPWAYPGDPWQVAVGLVVGYRGSSYWSTARDLLRRIPTFEDADPTALGEIKEEMAGGKQKGAIERIGAVAAEVAKNPRGWQSDEWRQIAQLGPTAQSWYGLLTDESDGLVATAPVRRVAGRIAGDDYTKQKSNGRMELAILVGCGKDAPTLNAAMHRLGTNLCTPTDPACDSCPVREVCCVGAG